MFSFSFEQISHPLLILNIALRAFLFAPTASLFTPPQRAAVTFGMDVT
jgi:hypothetical protein